MSQIPSSSPVLGFRADVEGLRALAILAVLAFHASVPGWSGGFVGVDVFFVISGFLITGLLVEEVRKTGGVSLPAFFARRARRLLPASMLVLLFVAVGAHFFSSPIDIPLIAGDLAAAALYVSNLRFASQSADYLGGDREASPVLHYWSLAVEEQFYLFWPLLIVLAAVWLPRLLRRRGDLAAALSMTGLWLMVVLVAIGSLALALWLTGVSQPWSFFSPATRAWEFALGAMVFLGQGRLAALPAGARAGLGWLGIALLAGGVVSIDQTSVFPSLMTVLPVLGTAAVIAGGVRAAGESAPGLASPVGWLELAPMRAIGRVSYSLYLWHWPAIVFATGALGHLSWPMKVGFTALSAIPAVLAYRWVEKPLHFGHRLPRTPRAGLAVVGVASGSGLLAAALLAWPVLGPWLRGAGEPPASAVAAAAGVAPALEAQILTARDDLPSTYRDGCHLSFTDQDVKVCAYGAVDSKTTVVLFGDSKAAQWFPVMETLATRHGWRLLSMTKSGCTASSVTLWLPTHARNYTECDQWRQAVLDKLADEIKPTLVVMSGSFPGTTVDRTSGERIQGPAAREDWKAGWVRSLSRLQSAGVATALLVNTPSSRVDVAACVSENMAATGKCDIVLRFAPQLGPFEAGAADAVPGVAVLSMNDLLCNDTTCPAVSKGWLVYRDKTHLTSAYSLTLVDAMSERLGALLPTGAGGP